MCCLEIFNNQSMKFNEIILAHTMLPDGRNLSVYL